MPKKLKIMPFFVFLAGCFASPNDLWIAKSYAIVKTIATLPDWANRLDAIIEDTVCALFITCYDNHIYEVKKIGDKWEASAIASFSLHPAELTIANLDNDNKMEIYSTNWDGYVYVTRKINDSYSTEAIAKIAFYDRSKGICTGDARNDGKNRLYVSTWDGTVYEIELEDSSWNYEEIYSDYYRLDGIETGDGRNDGKNRVYVASYDGSVVEIYFENNEWHYQKIHLSNVDRINDVTVAQLYDDKKRVYATCGDGNVYELEWKGSWNTRSICKLPTYAGRIFSYEGKLYVICESHLYEIYYKDGWNISDLGEIGESMRGIDILNDNIYLCDIDGKVFEVKIKEVPCF